MSESKNLATGSLWYFSIGLLIKSSGFIYTVILARFVAQDDVGAFAACLSILGLLAIFGDMGFLNSFGRYVPYLHGSKKFGKLRELVKMSYFGGGTIALIFSILVFVFAGNIAAYSGKSTIETPLKILAIFLLLREVQELNKLVMAGRKKMKEYQGLELLQTILKLIITGILVFKFGGSVNILSIAFIMSFLLVIPVGLYLLKKESKNWKNNEVVSSAEKRSLAKEVISFGLMTTLASMFAVIIEYSDKIMLTGMLENSLSEVAIYAMAFGLATIILIFPGSIISIFCPIVTELHGQGKKKEMRNITAVSIKWAIMVSIPVIIMMVVFGKNLLAELYGAQYSGGWLVLSLLVVGLFIRSIYAIPSSILIAMKRVDVELKVGLVTVIANVVLNFVLIPVFRINGAALTSLMSLSLGALLIHYYSNKIYGFRFPKEAYKPLIAGIIGFVVIFLLKEQIFGLLDTYLLNIQIGSSQGQLADLILQKIIKLMILGILFLVSCVVYFLALLGLRSFGEDEIDLLEKGLRKIRIPEKYINSVRTILEAKYLGSH